MAVVLLALVLPGALVPGAIVQAQPATPVGASFDHYTVEAAFDPAARTIAGTLHLTWTNLTGQEQSRIPFRLYPNAPAYERGGIEVRSATVDGVETTASLAEDETVLWIDVSQPVMPGEVAEIGLAFVTAIPTDTSMAVNVLHGTLESGWWLADWVPILAGWEDETGWYLESPGTLGNPTFATSATWSLSMTMPAGLATFGTGTVTGEIVLGDGQQQVTVETSPVRDLTLVLLPTSTVQVTTLPVDDVQVRLVLPIASADPGLANLVLDTAASVLPFYTSWLGLLPAAEIDLVPVDLDGFGGIAWSDSVWLDLAAHAPDLDPATRADLPFVVAHELAHQWVPHVIGSNNNRHNFLSESLASHLALLALDSSGAPGIDAYLNDVIVASYRRMLERGEDGVVDDPAASTVATAERAALIYGKGVLGFEAIRQAIGTDAYLAGLEAYAGAFRFGVSTPNDLLLAMEAASGQDLTHLWDFWFTQATTSIADLDEIVAGFPADHRLGVALPAVDARMGMPILAT